MSTLNVNTINAATSGQGVAVDVQNPRSFRNLIVNGAMQVAQRGTSTTTNNTFCVDRWKCQFGGTDEAPTFSQHALTSSDTGPWAKGFRNSFHIQNGNQTGGAGASDYNQIRYIIEAQDIANSGWDYTSSSSYITFSYWIKSSIAQEYYWNLQTSDGTEYRYVVSTGSLSANTWTKVTNTIPGNANLTFNNDTGSGLVIYFWPFLGTSWTSATSENTWITASGNDHSDDYTSTWWTTNDATVEFTGVQLEVGSYATDFEHRSYGDELARCKRYYQLNEGNTGYAYSSTTCRCIISGTVDMRTGPSIAIVAGTNAIEDFGSANRNLTNLGGLSGASTLGGMVDATIASSTSGKPHGLSAGAISMSAEL